MTSVHRAAEPDGKAAAPFGESIPPVTGGLARLG